MPRITNTEFLAASTRYAERTIKQAAGNAVLSKAEQATLPQDMQDNVQMFRDQVVGRGNIVRADEFLRWNDTMLTAAVAYADKDHDGALTGGEPSRLLDVFADNYANYVRFRPTDAVADAAFNDLKSLFDDVASKLIVESEGMYDAEAVRIEAGENPTDDEMLDAAFPNRASAPPTVDYEVRSAPLFSELTDMLGAKSGDPADTAAAIAELRALFDRADLVDLKMVSSSEQTPIGGGGTFYLVARHVDSNTWVGFGGDAVWA